jgi:hypothetical protein
VPDRNEVASRMSLEARLSLFGEDCSVISNA